MGEQVCLFIACMPLPLQVSPEFGSVCGEPIFIPAPNAASEDGGVLIAMVVQPDGYSAMVFLDGRNMDEVARAVLPYGVPVGFHGAVLQR